MKILISFFLLYTIPAFTKINQNDLLSRYSSEQNGEKLTKLKADTLKMGGKSVPALVEVMKSEKYPDRNRWIATFLLARIMGEKSSDFLVKFLDHPNWIMRLASLKALLALKQTQYEKKYAEVLKDDALLVRLQSLENINRLGLSNLAPSVWAMLYDQKNYYQMKNSNKKRGEIIKKVITTVGDLKFKKAQETLLIMIQKPKYDDIFNEMDYSLSKIVGKKSPDGSMKTKRYFWSRLAMASNEI